MSRAASVIAALHRHDRPVADTVILDYATRSAGHAAVTSVQGRAIEIDLHGSVRLRTDDLLVLDEGDLVEVVAAPEPLIEARAADVAALARLAWHLGDRHIAVQLLPNRIRARRDESVETLLAALGAKVTPIEAPFEPEGGAYAPPPVLDHDHHHNHGHDRVHHDRVHHDHVHHDHVHDAHCGHDHSHDHAHDHGHSHHGHKHD